MRIVFWGTYDIGKPRNRILLRGLRENGVELTECHVHVWAGVEDKSRLQSFTAKLLFLLRWLAAYPILIFQYLRLPKHDVVLVGYLGQLDVLVIWPFAKLRGAKLVWDAFLSLHDTVVNDRKLCAPTSITGRFLYWWEWLACKAADKVILDTAAHGEFFQRHYRMTPEKIGAVFVGVEPEVFPPVMEKTRPVDKKGLSLLFYGQCIPLHGIPTILKAARLLQGKAIYFTIIGSGQELEHVQQMMDEQPLESVRLIPWVEYQTLHELIHKADVCLGIFGDSDKAGRVIPNKVFQIIQSGKPLITRDSEAIRELLSPDTPGVFFVDAASPEALAEVIQHISESPGVLHTVALYKDIKKRIHPRAIGRQVLSLL